MIAGLLPEHQAVDHNAERGRNEPLHRVGEMIPLVDRWQGNRFGRADEGRIIELQPCRGDVEAEPLLDQIHVQTRHPRALSGVDSSEEAVLDSRGPQPTGDRARRLGIQGHGIASGKTAIDQDLLALDGLEQPDHPVSTQTIETAIGDANDLSVEPFSTVGDSHIVELILAGGEPERFADGQRLGRGPIQNDGVLGSSLFEPIELPESRPEESGDQARREQMGQHPARSQEERPISDHDETVSPVEGCQTLCMPLERGKPPATWIVRVCLAVSILSMSAGWIGDLLLAQFVDKHPLLLIALNPRNRNLVLATNELEALSYYAVGFARLVASDPVNYLLGFWFGDRAIAWTERRSRTYGPLIRDGEGWFRKLSYPLIFAAPNNIICALSGATGVSVRAFVLLNVSGTVTRLVAIRALGATLESPISGVVDFIAQYRTPILILSAVGVAWTVFGEFRGDNSELQTLRSLDDEPSDTEPEDQPPDDPSA
jgi:membrane protein DedA with SNARE-associated domain